MFKTYPEMKYCHVSDYDPRRKNYRLVADRDRKLVYTKIETKCFTILIRNAEMGVISQKLGHYLCEGHSEPKVATYR